MFYKKNMDLPLVTTQTDFTGKTILVRIDTDVDVENGTILDDTRLKASLDTVNSLLRKGAIVILLGHLGRPEGEVKKDLSLAPVAVWFGRYFQRQIQDIKLQEFSGWQITSKLFLLENLRFYKGEEANDPEFVGQLASLGQLYVDDAFAVSHRNHASIAGIPTKLPSYAGIHFAKEITTLTDVVKNPKRPLAILIGGAKIETKLPLVEKMHTIADYVLVGGEIAEQDKVLISVQHEKIQGKKSAILVADLTESTFDITPKDVESFIQILQLAQTIVWNGPVGLTGKEEQYESGTKAIAEAIIATSAYKIVGGGDTLTYLQRIHILDKFDFVSTGGGAMLEFLAGKELPGVSALLNSLHERSEVFLYS